MESFKMKTTYCEYFDPGCFGKCCKFYGKETEDIYKYPAGYSKNGNYSKEPSAVVWKGFECLKTEERGKLRQDIYSRALAASDKVHKEYSGNKIHFEIKAASKAFDNIADEWTKKDCTFFEER
jgi:hypothetical protein